MLARCILHPEPSKCKSGGAVQTRQRWEGVPPADKVGNVEEENRFCRIMEM
jgi:hypothetical protein